MTDRQREILTTLIQEYLDTADNVGSASLVSKYKLGVSPATVRNEMSLLTKKGYLSKTHSSAGRRPTPLALRKFVEDLIEEIELEHLDETRAKQLIHRHKHDRERLIREAVQQLVALTKMTAIALTPSGMFYGGISHLVQQPEFGEVELLQRVMNVVEDYDMLHKVFAVAAPRDVKVVIGPEFGLESMRNCAVVYKDFDYFRDQKGVIAVLGPTRMDYSRAIPAVRLVSQVLSNAVQGW